MIYSGISVLLTIILSSYIHHVGKQICYPEATRCNGGLTHFPFSVLDNTLQTLSILWDFLFDSLLWSCSSASHNMLRNQGVNRKNSIADILHPPGGNSRALAIYSTFTIIWLMLEMSERHQRSVQFTNVGLLLWREWIMMTGWKQPLRHECFMLTLQLPFSCLCLSLSVVFSLILSVRQVSLIFDEHREL